MVTQQRDQKITYTTMSVDQAEEFNRRYDQALEGVRSQLGRSYPIYINNNAVSVPTGEFDDQSPNDTRVILGTFAEADKEQADAAVSAARAAFPVWSSYPWQKRVEILMRGADIFRERKYEIAAWLSLEAGKPRLESMGEIEEAADLISGYCRYMEDANGFVIELERLSPGEVNHSVLKPYGVWAVIAPFNFPVALTTGMIAGALVAGNSVVFKPSHETPLVGTKVFECLRDAGLPAGTLNFVTGHGNKIGELLSGHPGVDGIVFTGSAQVGTRLFREFSRQRPRPCIAEMGGKNPTIVTQHADLDKAVEGTTRAAFGYSGQKCSATSRVYVHEAVAEEFLRRFANRTHELAVGPAERQDVFMGPVINEAAYERFKSACERARRDGEILTGGTVLTDGDLQYGYYCSPTIVRLPKEHEFFREELFVPFVAVATVTSLDEALELSNDSKYGLTAGVFTEDEQEQQQFLDRMEAGVIYVNRRGGSTTGAWPRVQSFGGWKMSGSTGKSALGPYYVQQFMHEQSQTVVES
jgi:1-pyrroline-5-carboxylate dehydrogenase